MTTTPTRVTPADVALRRPPEPPRPGSGQLFGFQASLSPLETLQRALGNEQAYLREQMAAETKAAKDLAAVSRAIAESKARIAEYDATIERLGA